MMNIQRLITANVIAFALHSTAMGQTGAVAIPPIPPNLKVPAGNSFYLKGSATGTQNYVCLPGENGPAWKFLAPQATLFVTLPWFQREIRHQVATHYLSANPAEGGTARPTWQHSVDTSTVWGKAIATSTDSQFVAPGAIPWLLVEVVCAQRGPMGGFQLSETTFIQRLSTAGGVAPASGCEVSAYGSVALVPYTTDYYFYKADHRN